MHSKKMLSLCRIKWSCSCCFLVLSWWHAVYKQICKLLPPASAVEVIETEPFVCLCVCVCQLVSTLTAERIDLRSRNLAQGLTLIKSWRSLMVKVKGQGHQVKIVMSLVFSLQCQYTKCWPTVWHYDVMWHHGMMSWHHSMTSWRHSMTSSVFLLWDRYGTREVQQHFSVFFNLITVPDFLFLYLLYADVTWFMLNGHCQERASIHQHPIQNPLFHDQPIQKVATCLGPPLVGSARFV